MSISGVVGAEDYPEEDPFSSGRPGGVPGQGNGQGNGGQPRVPGSGVPGGPGAPGAAPGQGGPRQDGSGSFERTPPQDVAAEQCVLGGMLLSKDAIADVVEILRANDFYRPVHTTVFDAILDLYGRGEPADPITVAAALADAGTLVKVGGAPYLHTLIASVPTAANASYYARIVAERAVLRRLVEAGTRIVQLGYGNAGGGRDVDDIVDLAQQAVYDITEKRVSEDFAILADMLQPTLDEIEAVGAQGGAMTGIPTGFTDLDRLLNGLHSGQLIIVAGRPGLGKSTAAMDFARAASVRNNLASAIFSLEMSKVEIVMRLLSAEARVPLHVLRSGQLSDDDWTKLARRMGEISEAPLFVDDTPNMTLMEIRAKSRRLRQRHDLKLIVVDYLQLMTSPKRTESRQQEVADLSRGLKLLAKEVECPVVAVSQLNRGPEQRTDKRPQLSDLRESGCMTAVTTLLRADTGTRISFGELMEHGCQGMSVWSMDEAGSIVAAPLTRVFASGVKEVFSLRLGSGRVVEASANHPFRTRDGWVRLDQLTVGQQIAVPRRVPEPLGAGLGWSPRRIARLGRAVGCGGVRRGRPVPTWMLELGCVERSGRIARVPDQVFGGSTAEVDLFLRHLWAAGGGGRKLGAAPSRRGRAACLAGPFRTGSRHLADDVAMLATRLGLLSTITTVRAGAGRPGYQVRLVGEGRRAARPPAGGGTSDRGGDDLHWDRILSVTPRGPRPVYDATVKGTHSFVANGIVAHNSIEQDADVVILLHRDDYYDKESPRAGEADFIVAKHRNGPTDTVTVAAQLHLSRFVDMAVV